MRAIVRTEYGSAEVLRLIEVDRPTPGPREVLVRVDAAGVDIGVWHLMTGLPKMARLALGLRRPRHAGLGSEFAGVVDAVGTKVTRFSPGDPVFGVANGSFAEFALAAESKIAPLPSGVAPEAAAVSAVSGVTAYQALVREGRVASGQRVLVLGASGGVGSFAVQIARELGAHVTGAASAEKRDVVLKLGVDEVFDYAETDVTDGSRQFDVILEMGGMRRDVELRRALTPTGRAVIVGGEGGGDVTGGFLGAMTAGLRSTGRRQKVVGLISVMDVDDLSAVATMLTSGAIVPAIDRRYPLAETAEALRRLASRQVRGKLVIDPQR